VLLKGYLMNFMQLAKNAEKFAIDNSPAILTAIGITGTLTTAYLTGKASIKACRMLEAEPPFETDRKNAIKKVWKLYIPPVVTGAITVAAIVSANHVSSRRTTAMATAYSISERAFSEYKDKVVEKIGEKKEREYRDEIAQDRVNNNPVSENQVIITDNGDVLCFDHFTGRYFKSSMETLKQAENEVNHLIITQGYASLSDFYHDVGLPATSLSDSVGWNSDKLLQLEFSTVLSQDNRPCISIDFDISPSRKFSSFG
jgi:hypothetical protein